MGAIHLLARRTGLIESVDKRLHLLKVDKRLHMLKIDSFVETFFSVESPSPATAPGRFRKNN